MILYMLLMAGCTAGVPAPPVAVIVSHVDVVVPDVAPLPSRRYRDTLIRETRVTWGMNGAIALFAAQVEQESGWNVNAKSPVGASGLGQFMPSTAQDLGALGFDAVQPYNPDWSLRALTRYDKQLYDHAGTAADDCERHAFMLVGYNGGEGWRIRDQRQAVAQGLDNTRYFGNVERINAGRSAAAWQENRQYVPAILRRQPHYATWGKGVCT